MNPNKKKTINGHKIEQFYWEGRTNVVYIDHRLTNELFDEITAKNVESVFKKTQLKRPKTQSHGADFN